MPKKLNIKKNIKILSNLELIAHLLPGPIYWKDKNSVYLGMNEFALQITGLKSFADIIGKSDYDLWPQLADELVKHDKVVMNTGKPLHTEEVLIHPKTGDIHYFAVVKVPLRDEKGNIIGVLGNSIEITSQKKSILHYLELIAHSLPGPIYWKDKNSVYLGMNKFVLDVTGIKSFEEFIGKTDYDLWPQFADELVKHDQEVMQTGMLVTKEESIVQPDGTIKYFTVVKIPLRDYEGNIIGIIGNSLDITAQKEKERLEQENQAHLLRAQEDEKFRKIVGQMVHDIHSPLSSLQTIVQSTTDIPENERVTLREVAMSISDITNHMLSKYKNESSNDQEKRRAVLASALLLPDKI